MCIRDSARRGVRRDQVARDTHGGLRRSGLHRYPSGDPPRGAGAVRERRVGCRPEFLPSDSFGGRGETRGRLFVSHDSLHGECHGLVRAIPGSDAHFTASAERKLAQIDRHVVEQQYLSVQLLRGMIVRYVFDSHYLILAKTMIGLSSSFSQARAISFAIGDTGGCLW